MRQRAMTNVKHAASDTSSNPETGTITSAITGITGQGPAGSTLHDQDFKDTVLYMQQQQLMNHQELMNVMKQLVVKVQDQRGRSPLPDTSSLPPPPQYSTTMDVSDVPLGVQYTIQKIAQGTLSSEPIPFEIMRDSELQAARSRITFLEQQVQTLTAQLESKERAIQRLTEAAIQSTEGRIHMKQGIAGGGTQYYMTPTKAIEQHQLTTELLRSKTHGGGSQGATPTSNSELQNLLAQHRHRCELLTHQ